MAVFKISENMSVKYKEDAAFGSGVKGIFVLVLRFSLQMLFRVTAAWWQQRRHEADDVWRRLEWWKKMGQVIVLCFYHCFPNLSA